MPYSLGGVSLPDDLIYSNEFAGDWSPVKRIHTEGSTGRVIVQAGLRKDGRPIELTSGEKYGWADRATVLALYALQTTTTAMTLEFGEQTFNVVWADGEDAFAATPMFDISDPDDTDLYTLKIKLVTIEVTA